MSVPSSRWRVHLVLLTVSICFGLHYYWGKEVLASFDDPGWPMAWSALRVSAAAGLLLALAVFRGNWRLPGPDLLKLAGLSALGIVLNQACFIEGLQRTTPTQAALINTSIPVLTLLAARLMGQETLGWRKAAGIVLAIAGASVLLLPKVSAEAGGASTERWGNALVLANACSFSLFLVLSRPLLRRTDALAATAWIFVFGAIGLDLLAGPALMRISLGQVPHRAWAFGILIIVFATVLTYALNSWALRRVEASTVAAYIYLQPLIAGVCEALFLGGRFGLSMAVSGALVFTGVALGTARGSHVTAVQAQCLVRRPVP